jgi:hypothetical protein
MPIMTVHCSVSRADVVRVTDLEGATLRVICPDYDEGSRLCRLKTRAQDGGPLARLLVRASAGTLAAHGIECELV